MFKVCSSCGEEKLLDQFGLAKQCKFGVRGECKECYNIKMRASYKVDPQLWERHREKNKDRHVLYMKEYQATHKEEAKAWRRVNLDKGRMSAQKRRSWVKSTAPQGVVPSSTWKSLLEFYGEACMYPECVIDLSRSPLELDHIVPLSVGGRHEVDNFQILCKHHNCSKGAKNSTDYRPLPRMVGVQNL